MASTVQFGRIGLDVSFESAVTGYQEASSFDEGRQVTFSGLIKTSTLADTIALRSELPALSGQVVPILWSFDSTLDGYYGVSDVTIDASAQSGSYVSGGLFGFTITAKLVGSSADVEFQSKLIGSVVTNDKGVANDEVFPFIGLPPGAYAYVQGSESPSYITRTGADGGGRVYFVPRTPFPTWSVAESDFYNGAASIYSGGYIRQGGHIPNDPTDWELSNALVRITPNGSNGRLDVEHHDGSQWDTADVWTISSGGSEVGEWDSVSILLNRPEVAAVRLLRERSTIGRYTLDLELRRGSRIVNCYFSTSASATNVVALNGATSGTAITPSGATSAVAARNGATIAGNRALIGSGDSTPSSTAISVTSSFDTVMDFFLSSEVGYVASSGDDSDYLCLEYLGYIAESVGVRQK